jgi:nucleotide-binding universal stress UspA family protein
MKVLLATDGSEEARAAAELLGILPLPPDTTVTVVNVAVVPRGPLAVPTAEELREVALKVTREIAQEGRAAVASRWPEAQIAVLESDARGDVREALIHATEGADLIVLGARGLGAVKGFFLGSVSTAIARQARCSVLVAKGAVSRIDRALVGVDGSEDSRRAIAFLAGLGDLGRLRVRLFGVVPEPDVPIRGVPVMPGLVRAALAELLAQRRAELERVIAEAAAPLAGRVAALETVVEIGRPAERIVAQAAQPGVSLVVVGARGLGALGRLLLGSVSEKVLHHAHGAVLIVR